MLVTLRVRNFVLIDDLEIHLGPGLNVITGETGAGKSIVIGALGLVLGGRARAEMVRPGCTRAEVEALFDVSDSPAVRAQLEALELDALDAETAAEMPCAELVIRRVVHEGGRSRAYVNGRLCTVTQLAELARGLADVTSQHESVALTDPGRHVDYLDRFAKLVDDRAAVGEVVGRLEAVVDQLRRLEQDAQTRQERAAFLRYQLEKIDAVDPAPGEDEELSREVRRLKHADRIASVCQTVTSALEGGLDGSAPIADELGRLVSDLERAAELDDELAEAAREVEECWRRLTDVGRDVGRYLEGLEADPRRLGALQSRQFELDELLRLHGPTVDAVFETKARLAGELEHLEGADRAGPELEGERDELLALAGARATALSQRRQRAAKRLGKVISRRLDELGMGRAKVVVDVQPHEVTAATPEGLRVDGARLGRDGIDRVQFLIAPNRGVEPRPLARIASGGELSRALLALKRALLESAADEESGGLQVFDEVDTGVGGETADKIGRSIAAIASQRQVLCITHLAAIAAYADVHFVAAKADAPASGRDADATTTTICRLDDAARPPELARMLTGSRANRASLTAARDLLRSVHQGRAA